MESSSLANALTTIAACAGVGAFIDFWIGRTGEKCARAWLEDWWLRMSYVRLGNFGREEALVAIQGLEKLFGRRLFSIQRLLVSLSVVILFTAVFFFLLIKYNAWIDRRDLSLSTLTFYFLFHTLEQIPMDFTHSLRA
jgi:hypothetical protein